MNDIDRILEKTGLNCIYKGEDFIDKQITLRDGRISKLWVNKNDGHGILDDSFWENSNFYYENYRKEFSANLDTCTSSKEHLDIYKDVNKRQFNQFSNLINKSTKFLEIGCSFGGILNHMNIQNIEYCCGLEPNKQDAEFCKISYEKCDIVNSLFEDYNFIDKKFNIIVSFEVLEHIFNLRKFIEKLYSILDTNGFINFEVPNHHDALLINYKINRYQSFNYHKSHIHYFTPESLSNIFSHFGFHGKVFGFQTYSFFNQVYWLYNNCPQKSAKEAISFPKVNEFESESNKIIYDFFENVNRNYQKLSQDNLISDCLIFKGIKK
jgi:2-polyprenyl-3-methyl-5-hydroxy-6-metoxy-1,4-benzoquinol methylase